MRTVATIGDKPLATVTGAPGESTTSQGEPEPPLDRRSRTDAEGRISGRVVDDQGDPVAGARVRLAVSSAPGGRMVQGTTDRAGGFTLRGLRPGMSYTVIAEWEDGADVMTGRSTVQAPDSDVRIALNPDETAPQAAGLTARVNPVSRRGAAEEPAADLVASPINVEDLPPAPEADAIAPALSSRRSWRPQERSQPAQPRPSAGRMVRAQPQPANEAESPAEPDLAPSRGAAAAAGLPPIDAPAADDDGPNPLPPALEPGETSMSLPEAADVAKVAAAPPAAPSTDTAMLLAAADEPSALPDLPPGTLVAAPPPVSRAPASRPQSPAGGTPALPGAEGPVASGDSPAVLPPPVESGESDFPPADAAPRPRPRWRDLAAGESSPPPLEPAVRGSPSKEPDTYCRYDTAHRRIEDFRLPDLQGRLVRFQDFDADLILLDFWGSWCQPCLRAVPHLIDLQKRHGAKQLQVIGIACEREETPAADRVAGAAKAAKKLGMNYPVLVTTNDGSCPLQKALHVQSYPTLILVDRRGRILWQDQGATRLTMMRLDRMINMAAKPADGRRRF
jgi:thiol-disulfide isomerase/thioredoxin